MTVLVGVQGPDSSRAAIRAAAQEAAFRGSKLVAMTSYNGNGLAAAPAARPGAGAFRTAGEQRAGAERLLRDAVQEALGPEAAGVSLRLAHGMPGRNLVEAARVLDAGLLVLSSRPAAGLSWLVGSQYVLRNTPCQLLLVPESGTVA